MKNWALLFEFIDWLDKREIPVASTDKEKDALICEFLGMTPGGLNEERETDRMIDVLEGRIPPPSREKE